MSWTSLAQTVGASLGGSYLFSWLMAVIAGNTTQQLVNRTGRSNGQLWFMKPGILVHEALHAVVGLAFGLHITAFSLRPTADSAAHVSFRYASHSWRARLGLFFSASAPVWGISAALLLLGKRAWWPQLAWAAISPHNLAPDWPWVAGWALLTVMLTFGLALSHQDLVNMWRGTPFLVVLLGLAYAVLAWLAPAALAGWWRVNQLAGGFALVMLALSVVVNRLVAWLAA